MTVTRKTALDDLPEFLRAEEVAAYLGISKCTVYAMVVRRELPAVKFGRLVRIRRDGLETLKASA